MAEDVRKRVERPLEQAAERAAVAVAKKAVPAAVAAAPAVAGGLLVLGTAAASYLLARFSSEGYGLSREAKIELANRLYRDGRNTLVKQLHLASPRDIPKDALEPLKRQWLQSVADAEANTPTLRGIY